MAVKNSATTSPGVLVTSATMDLPSVSAGTAGWTPAERHLLRGYREELAEALAAVYRDLSADRGAAAHFTTAPRRERSAQDLELLGLSACFADLESGLRETVASLAAGLGLGEAAILIAMPAALAASWGFILPAGTGPNAIAWSTGRLRIEKLVRAGLVLDIIGIFLIVGLVWGMAALI